jgi:hypothetical protein
MSYFEMQVHKAGEPGRQWAAKADWAVSLPHQCDDWVIAADPDRVWVLSEVRRFRDEVNQAIAVLEESVS